MSDSAFKIDKIEDFIRFLVDILLTIKINVMFLRVLRLRYRTVIKYLHTCVCQPDLPYHSYYGCYFYHLMIRCGTTTCLCLHHFNTQNRYIQDTDLKKSIQTDLIIKSSIRNIKLDLDLNILPKEKLLF